MVTVDDFHPESVLLDRLTRAFCEGRPVVMMVGSALAVGPDASGARVGVPGVDPMVAKIRAELGLGPDELKGPEGYRAGLRRLMGAHGPDAVNALIQSFVLEATSPGMQEDLRANLDRLEERPNAWRLPVGMAALGRLVAHVGDRAPKVLTTNFDPLVEVAVRAAGGRVVRQVVDREGRLEAFEPEPDTTAVVHLHGHWNKGDTLHTATQLTTERPHLQSSIEHLLEHAVVVVLGYGGWDDIFMRALLKVVSSANGRPDVLWAFYGKPSEVISRDAALLTSLAPAMGRVTYYAGVDAHRLLPELAGRLARDKELPSRHAFVGRIEVRDEVMNALEAPLAQPIQIRALPKMGGSAFLRDLERRLHLAGHRVARVDGRWFTASPPALVQAAAVALGCEERVNAALHARVAIPDAGDAARALAALGPAVLLVDHADALGGPGHRFTESFFAAARALSAQGDLRWVSVSPRSLRDIFPTGNGSPFLNDARTVHLPPLDRDETGRALAATGLDDSALDWIFDESGGAPALARYLAEQLGEGHARDGVAARLDGWSAPVFEHWAKADVDAVGRGGAAWTRWSSP